jgi:hypothetical protein
MSITQFPIPIASMRVDTTTPATPTTVQDTNLAKYVMRFDTGANKDAHFCIWVPPNYTTGNLQMRWDWITTAAAGNASWDLEVLCRVNAGALNIAPGSATGVSAAPGVANQIASTLFNLSPGGLAAGALFLCMMRRRTTSDTLAANVWVQAIRYHIPTDPTFTKLYAWAFPQAWKVPTASGAARSSRALTGTTIIKPSTVVFRDANSDYIDLTINTPEQFNAISAPLLRLYAAANGTGNFVVRIDAASIAVGDAVDKVLTSGSNQTITGPGSASISVSSDLSLPVTPTAGAMLRIRLTRLGSDGSDTATTAYDFLGAGLTFEATGRNPGYIILDPASCAEPTTDAMTHVEVNGTNSSGFAARAPDAQDTRCDFTVKNPSIYGTGGTIVIRWSSSGAGDAAFKVGYASPAVGANNDPSLTDSDVEFSTSAGAGLLNEIEIPIAGLVESDNINIRIWRMGADSGDTIGADVDIWQVLLKSNVAA